MLNIFITMFGFTVCSLQPDQWSVTLVLLHTEVLMTYHDKYIAQGSTIKKHIQTVFPHKLRFSLTLSGYSFLDTLLL